MLKKKKAYTVAVLGATGAVGKESLEILEERGVEIDLPIVRNAPYQHLYDLRNPAARASSSEQNQRFDFIVLT